MPARFAAFAVIMLTGSDLGVLCWKRQAPLCVGVAICEGFLGGDSSESLRRTVSERPTMQQHLLWCPIHDSCPSEPVPADKRSMWPVKAAKVFPAVLRNMPFPIETRPHERKKLFCDIGQLSQNWRVSIKHFFFYLQFQFVLFKGNGSAPDFFFFFSLPRFLDFTLRLLFSFFSSQSLFLSCLSLTFCSFPPCSSIRLKLNEFRRID